MVVEVTAENVGLLLLVEVEARENSEAPSETEMAEAKKRADGLVAAKDRAKAFLYMQGDKAVGYIVADISKPNRVWLKGANSLDKLEELGHIARTGVIPSARKADVALALLFEAERWLRSLGVKGAWLDYLPNRKRRGGVSRHCPYGLIGYADIEEFTDSKDRIRRIAVKKW